MELIADIGESEEELKRVLKDRAYINRLVVLGYTREEAERYSFIGDLQNILSLMRSHQFSAKTAARLLGQTPDSPYEFKSTEEEDEEEEPPHTESDDTTSYPSSPSTSHLWSSCSITSSSSEDDTPAARKRIKLDPDYVPSNDTTPADTAASSQVSSENEQEEEEEEETDAESFVPSDRESDGDDL